jgi:hypothetical protein
MNTPSLKQTGFLSTRREVTGSQSTFPTFFPIAAPSGFLSHRWLDLAANGMRIKFKWLKMAPMIVPMPRDRKGRDFRCPTGKLHSGSG